MLVDLCTSFRAGAVGKGPGPNFGRKPDQKMPKLKSIFKFHNLNPESGQRSAKIQFAPERGPERLPGGANCRHGGTSLLHRRTALSMAACQFFGLQTCKTTWWPFQRANTYVFYKPGRAPETPQIGRESGPRTPPRYRRTVLGTR